MSLVVGNNNKRIAIYVRVSTKHFAQGESVDNQISYFKNYVDNLGGQLVEVYVDNGISGTSLKKRTELRRLMKDAEKQMFDVVYVKSISRWARDTVDSLNLIRKLRSLNIRLRSITENYDSFTDQNEFFLTIHSAVAQQESELTSARIKFSTAETARKGKHHGTPPYGYNKVNGRLVPSPLHSITVQEIFKLYLYEGWGVQKIANYLTSNNVPTPRRVLNAKNAGDKWHDSAVRIILTNPHYVGDLVQGRETTSNDKVFLQKRGYKSRIRHSKENHIVVKNTHSALISHSEFEEVQSKLTMRAERIFRGRGNKSIFARLAFCADCGAGMIYKKDRKSYVCGTYQKNGSKKCGSHKIQHESLKEAVLTDVHELASPTIDMQPLLEIALSRFNKQASSFKEELSQVNRELTNIQSELTQLTRKLAKGLIPNDLFQLANEDIMKEKKILESRASELVRLLSSEEDSVHHLSTFQKQLKKFVELQISDEEVLRQMLHNLIKRIEIFADGTISIHYRFKNPI
ncbi:recombinase family protein [Niallia circulans]|uniref:recombinase family protein n=1 Tax=Niallia circulans TaxID=1397 RepID=UPI0013DDD8CB|nr:recombinase family protein [Niallia circulans]